MNFNVTQPAIACFTKEWGFNEGDQIRIFVRYSGGGEDAFAFGIMKAAPVYPAVSVQHQNITFFIEANDLWYLDGKDLTLDCQNEEIKFVLN
ncbi:Fe-S cluster assembly protein HesB [Paenibacillus albiflavus]|uniref:Fe-S cluster assembly protein HesB n=1 Tax=Paenibacillus albiflavus TaxID=2545760 RepID=A0A4R4ELA4_9BACL|nr:Fe-S cluster assembly protein HesB [Paenibacillus albiflavus]TCZ80120.1 Fe-S cluster assembly protein HesB [Paenibacillus albiflavus]